MDQLVSKIAGDTMASREVALEGVGERLSWRKHCGFLELSVAEFTAIQEALLNEQIELVSASPIGRRFLPSRRVSSSREFRRRVPLTSYQDYEPFLGGKDESVLAQKPVFWAFTTTSAGRPKWAPFTDRAVVHLVHHLLASLILACAREKYHVNVSTSDRILYTVAPSPFLSGLLAHGLEQFGFRGLPPETHDNLGFHAAVRESVRKALAEGCDIMISLSAVTSRVAERISSMSSDGGSLWSRLSEPSLLLRVAKARLVGKIQRRPVLPRDLWKLKGLLSWGVDTSLLRDRIRHAWGVEPYEFLACTEAGILALQSWSKRTMTFVPAAGYLEFLPQWELEELDRDPGYRPETSLLGELQPGERYEVVVTSFYGMPFLRYRTGLLVRVMAVDNQKEGIQLPQVELVGRSDGLVDIAGFTRLDEKTVWDSLLSAGIEHGHWSVRRENRDGELALALYIEASDDANLEELKERVHDCLKERDPNYRDVEQFLGMRPLEIRPLAPGTFEAYGRSAPGTGVERDLMGQVPKLNASQEVIDKLVEISQLGVGQGSDGRHPVGSV